MNTVQDSLFWMKNKIFRPNAILEYSQAIKNLNNNTKELNEINWNKRKEIVKHAYNNSKFYNHFYKEHDFHPEQLQKMVDWEKIPILEKEDIKRNVEDIMTVTPNLLRKNVTSGSTGQPLICYHDARFHQEILNWRMYKLWEISPAEDMTIIWRIPKNRKHGFSKLINNIIWFPTKRVQIEATGITEENILTFCREFNKKGGILYGYAGTIAEIARYISKHKITIKEPQVISTFASPITSVDRELFKQVFNKSSILDQYCCNEVSCIAFNCPQSPDLHINWDYRHIDIVDINNNPIYNDSIGDLLLTDLSNFGFPIIKYRIGDKSSWVKDTCKCGCVSPQIRPIQGRISDHIMLPNGCFLSGEWLTTIFDETPNAVIAYQLQQSKDYKVKLLVIPNKEYINYRNEINQVVSTLQQKANKELDLTLVEVDSIPSDRGKHRYIISELKN